MADYAALHTAYCAGVNEALKGSGYTITCTRKGYNKVLNENGIVIAQLANIEFERKGGEPISDKDVTLEFDHPTEAEDGSLLLGKIRGYRLVTVLTTGEMSEMGPILEKNN